MIFRWLWSPPGRLIEHLLWRWGPYKRFTARLVFATLERDHPEFEEDIRLGQADLAAGRMYSMVNREFIPSDSWKPDDPIQPDNWHHDGERWVRNAGQEADQEGAAGSVPSGDGQVRGHDRGDTGMPALGDREGG